MTPRAPKGSVPKSAIVHVRMTEEERARLEDQAVAAGCSLSAYAHEMLTTGKVVVQQRRELSAEARSSIARIGNNLNQLAAAANAGKAPRSDALDLAAVELRAFLRALAAMFAEADREGPGHGSEAVRAWSQLQGRVSLPFPRQG